MHTVRNRRLATTSEDVTNREIFTAPFFFSSSLVVGWVLKLISGFWISAEMSTLFSES
jgi:hypothetical protein